MQIELKKAENGGLCNVSKLYESTPYTDIYSNELTSIFKFKSPAHMLESLRTRFTKPNDESSFSHSASSQRNSSLEWSGGLTFKDAIEQFKKDPQIPELSKITLSTIRKKIKWKLQEDVGQEIDVPSMLSNGDYWVDYDVKDLKVKKERVDTVFVDLGVSAFESNESYLKKVQKVTGEIYQKFVFRKLVICFFGLGTYNLADDDFAWFCDVSYMDAKNIFKFAHTSFWRRIVFFFMEQQECISSGYGCPFDRNELEVRKGDVLKIVREYD